MLLQGMKRKKSQEIVVYIYAEYTKEEYFTIGMEIVILLVTRKLPSLSSVAWYANPFLIPWIHIHSHTHKHTHAHIIMHTRKKGNKRHARSTFRDSNQTWQRRREIKKLRTNIRLINFIITFFTRDFSTIKNKQTLKHVLKFSSHTKQNFHRSSGLHSSLWQDTLPPAFPRRSADFTLNFCKSRLLHEELSKWNHSGINLPVIQRKLRPKRWQVMCEKLCVMGCSIHMAR